MELKRRAFIKLLPAAALGMLGAAGWAREQVRPRRITMALHGVGFPGRIRPPNEAEISRPAKWNG